MTFGTYGNLPTIDAGGEPRVLARLEPAAPSTAPRFFATADKPLPRDRWQEVSHWAWCPAIYDQNGKGSCVGHGTAAAFGAAWSMAGNKARRFSACYVYSLINGGSDRGAIVEDALKAMEKYGVCLESTVGPLKIYRSQYDTQAADNEAKRFTIFQSYQLDSFDEIASAVQLGKLAVFGIDIGRNFEPNTHGVIPERSGSGGGHCMYACGLKRISGKWYLEVPNSWHERWGLNGVCYIPESYFAGYVDAFVIETPHSDPQDPNSPPGM